MLRTATGLYKHYINHNQTLFTLAFRYLSEDLYLSICLSIYLSHLRQKKVFNSSFGSSHGAFLHGL